jgi:ribosomal protein S18 acetylase RimI-like enzyme
MSSTVTIRWYVPEDWASVARIHDLARVQEIACGGIDPRAFRPMSEVAAEDEFFVSKTLVACDSDEVIGFVSWNIDYITWLYVDPPQQRRGIGRKLLSEAIARIGPQAWVNVIGGNQPAIAIYRSVGMEIVWQRPSDCDGYPCTTLRMALPTSRMHNPTARRERLS